MRSTDPVQVSFQPRCHLGQHPLSSVRNKNPKAAFPSAQNKKSERRLTSESYEVYRAKGREIERRKSGKDGRREPKKF